MAVISPANVAERSPWAGDVRHCWSVADTFALVGVTGLEPPWPVPPLPAVPPALGDDVAVPAIAAGAYARHETASAHASADAGRREAVRRARALEDVVVITYS
jgi:hypothetical protein